MKIAAISIADYVESTEGMPHEVERLYFRMLLKMYSREGGIPDDDRENARMFGYRDVRTFKTLKAKLLRCPSAVYVEGGWLKNPRVEREVEDINARKKAAAEGRRRQARGEQDRQEIDERSAGDRVEIDQRSTPEVALISMPPFSNYNGLGPLSPSPSPCFRSRRNHR